MHFNYKAQFSLAQRSEETHNIKAKWPGRLPIILEKAPASRLEELEKKKYLCPADYTVQQFIVCMRKKTSIPKDIALFVFVNGTELISGEARMTNIYERLKDEDGFLYMMLTDQEVMG